MYEVGLASEGWVLTCTYSWVGLSSAEGWVPHLYGGARGVRIRRVRVGPHLYDGVGLASGEGWWMWWWLENSQDRC